MKALEAAHFKDQLLAFWILRELKDPWIIQTIDVKINHNVIEWWSRLEELNSQLLLLLLMHLCS